MASITHLNDDELAAMKKAMAVSQKRVEERIKYVKKRFWRYVAEEMENNGAAYYPIATLEQAWEHAQEAEESDDP